jgi:two-component system, NarL family, response regulator DesR
MRPTARAGDRGRMRTGVRGTPGHNNALRIMIIDDHEISRAAICSLLRSEGADVVADLSSDRDALAMARARRPEVVVIDVAPAADTGFGIARRLRALRPAPPSVLLTSSTDRARFGAQLDGHMFIAKADISSAAIAQLARSPETGGLQSRNQ